MIIEISNAAQQGLLDGYHFYEAQPEELGTYFLDSLTSDTAYFSNRAVRPFTRAGAGSVSLYEGRGKMGKLLWCAQPKSRRFAKGYIEEALSHEFWWTAS